MLEILDDSVDWHHDDGGNDGEEEIVEWRKNFVDDLVDKRRWWKWLKLWDGHLCSGVVAAFGGTVRGHCVVVFCDTYLVYRDLLSCTVF